MRSFTTSVVSRSVGALAVTSVAVALGACGGGGGGGFALAVTSAALEQCSTRKALSLQVTINKSVDGSTSFRLAGAPSGMAISSSGLVTWSPTFAHLGLATATLTVERDGEVATQSWSFRIHQGIAMGVALSPRGHTGSSTVQDYVDHYSKRGDTGEVIAFHGKWRDSVSKAGQIPSLATVAMTQAKTYGFTPVIGLGWSDGNGAPDLTSDGSTDNSWNNQETRAEFAQMVEDFAKQWKPPYLFLGNETNSYYVTHTPALWSSWITQFQACYTRIKAVSPKTLVFTTFNLEKMAGGGSKNGWTYAAHWQLIRDHGSKIDGIGFTTYPYFDHDTPAVIPANYFERIKTHWTGPVLFTEIGWRSSAQIPYPGSEADQANFVPRFFELTKTLDVEYVAWLFEHDWDGQATVPAFVGIGLKDNAGTKARLVSTQWRNAIQLRQR